MLLSPILRISRSYQTGIQIQGTLVAGRQRLRRLARGLSAFFCNHDNSFISGLRRIDDGEYSEVKVDTVSIEVFCAGKDLREVTFLKIDAEGYDLDVLRGVPWDTCRPEIILCEFDEKKGPCRPSCFQPDH